MNLLLFNQFLHFLWSFALLLRSTLTTFFEKKGLIGILIIFANISLLIFPFLTPVEEPPPISNPNFSQFPNKPRITYFSQDCNTTFTLSWDDARLYDVKLAPIDQKYGISHTIFAPSYRSYPNRSYWRYAFLMDELFQGYDVQSHCGKHVHLSQCSTVEREYYVKWGRTGIEELFGFTPIVFAYPFGDLGGSNFVKKYFTLGRTINAGGTSWPPSSWPLEGATISSSGIEDTNLNKIEPILQKIYHSEGYQVFKGYGHTNAPGKTYGVTDFTSYEETISSISGWPDVWYTSWGELVAYEIEKQFTEFSTINYFDEKLEFEFSTPKLNTDIFNVPLTMGILLPKSWENPYPQINNKFSSQFSIRDYKDSKELLLEITPESVPQKVTIWRDLNITDQTPPSISNLTLTTRYIEQDWDQDPQLLHHTFLRFNVEDSLSNVLSVNASVYLNDGRIFDFPNMKNPIFWKNTTYGRVIWDSSMINTDFPQIIKEDIEQIIIHVQDGFGNLLQRTIYSDGSEEDLQILACDDVLLRYEDKPQIFIDRLSNSDT